MEDIAERPNVQFLLSSNVMEEVKRDFEALEYNIIFYHPLPENPPTLLFFFFELPPVLP